MALPDITKHSVDKKLSAFCERRIPLHLRAELQLQFKFRGNAVTLIEMRPQYGNPSLSTESPVAQFRFDLDRRVWSLYFRDRNSRWRDYDLVQPTANFDALITEVDRDPTCIFWG